VAGQFTIGWTLPQGRGQYLLTYQGVADGDYDVEATGYQRSYIQNGGGGPSVPTDRLPWWHLSIQNGQLQTTKVPPQWNVITDDADHDQFPDTGEIKYPTTTVNLGAAVPDDLGNRVSTWICSIAANSAA
jgi:hypothetical protein